MSKKNYNSKNQLAAENPIMAEFKRVGIEKFNAYEAPANSEIAKFVRQHVGAEAPVLISKSKIPNAAVLPIENGIFVVTEALFKMLDSKPHGKMSNELKAVIGHEIGHIKEGGLTKTLTHRFLPITALPIVAVMARHYLSKINAAKIPPEQAEDFIKNQTDKDENPLPYDKEGKPYTKEETLMIGAAKDIAAATAGFTAGSLIARFNSNTEEFAADKWGAKLSGSPEYIKSVLNKLEKTSVEMRKNIKNGTLVIPDEDPFKYGKKAPTPFEKIKKSYFRHTIKAHPSTEARIKKLNQMAAKNKGNTAGEVAEGIVEVGVGVAENAAKKAGKKTSDALSEAGSVIEEATLFKRVATLENLGKAAKVLR